MINVVTSVVSEVADRVATVQGDLEMVRTVSNQTFEDAPGVQAGHDTLIEELTRWRDEAEDQVAGLGHAIAFIHQAFIEADQAMASAWDVNL